VDRLKQEIAAMKAGSDEMTRQQETLRSKLAAAEQEAAKARAESEAARSAAMKERDEARAEADAARSAAARAGVELKQAMSDSERAREAAARAASASAATSVGAQAALDRSGPSPFWNGKPWYSDLELREMMWYHFDPAKADDAQCIDWREAKQELARRSR
jgi:hypothetical protein